VEVRGNLPLSGKLILVANHARRFMDPLVLAIATPRELVIVSHTDLGRRPLAGLMARLAGTIFVTPSLAIGTQLVVECERALAGGAALGVFPEGREMGDGFGTFKPGASYLALRNHCPVVPVWIERCGLRRFLVVYGAPVTPEAVPVNRVNLERLTRELQSAVLALRPRPPTVAEPADVPKSQEPSS
jgi:1-acyl-sn-glycerol-3-phosphate acyltransferase